MLRSWLGSLTLIFLLGCASSGRVIPNKELDQVLANKESTLLLFAIDSRDKINKIHLSGSSKVVITYAEYQFVELAPGEYQIDKLEFDDGYINLSKEEDAEIWRFTIAPKTINYIGHFHLQSHYNSRYSFSLDNKSTSLLKYLENNFPNILTTRKLNYGGLEQDDFFQFISMIGESEHE